MAKMVTKQMDWSKLTFTCFDKDGNKYTDVYDTCQKFESRVDALTYWYNENDALLDIKDYRPCFVYIDNFSGVRGMPIDDFIWNADDIAEDGSRKNLVTRTIKHYHWKLYSFDANDNPVVTDTTFFEEMSKKQVIKDYDCDMAKMVGTSEQLMGMSVEKFFDNSVTVER